MRTVFSVAVAGFLLGACTTTALGQAATTTTLTFSSAGTAVASGGSINSPAQLTLTATVKAGATSVTKGTVQFCVTGAKLCTDVNLIGSAQLTTAGTASFTFVPPISKVNGTTPVPYSYTAVYIGTTADAKSSSAAATVTVIGTSPTTSVVTAVQTATNPPPYLYTLTDTVTGTTQNYPTGTVSFQDTTDGNYVLGTAPLVAGTSSFVLTAKPLVPSSTFPRYVAVGDLNGDGIPDIAVADFYLNTSITPNSSTVDIFFGKGDGTFTAGPLLSVGATYGPQFAILADFNNDGCLDVIAESYNNNDILLFLNTKTAGACTGTFQAVKTFTGPGGADALYGPGGLAVGDFNRDGNLDFIVNNNSSASGQPSTGTTSIIFFGDGAGGFAAANPEALAPGGTVNPQFTAVGDYNGDGYPDLAIGNNLSDTINIYLNNGTGVYTLKTSLNTPVGNGIVLTADFNQDGKLDLASASGTTSNPITIWLGNGDGTFTQAANPPVGAVSVASAAEADFNGDGIPDLIYNTSSSTAGGQIGVLLGKGDGTFTAPTTTYSTLGKDSLSLAVGDFNGDGYSDVVVGNFSGDLANPQADPNGVLGIYLAGYQTTGTATANLSNVSVSGVTGNPHEVDAVFPTNSTYTTSTSNLVPLLANEVTNDTLGLTAAPTGGTYGTQVALVATLSNYSSQGYSTNGENITFTLLGTTNTVLGTAPLSNGVAQLNLTTLPVGTDNIQATYTSDQNFVSAASNTAVVTITADAGTATLTAAPTSSSYGSPVVLTETINPINGTCPVGPATFTAGTPATNLGTGTITLNTTTNKCVATLTTSNVPVGSPTTVTATVPPSGDFLSITSTTPVTIAKAPITNPTTPTLSQTFAATPPTVTTPAQVTLVYTVPVASGNTAPTGPVVFSSPGFTSVTCSNFVAGTTANGITPYTCTSTTTSLPPGVDTITATYTLNDPNYAGGAPALTQNVTVNQIASTGDAVSPAATTITYSTPDQLTYSIPLVTGAPVPAGTVTFTAGTTALGSATWPATPVTGPCPVGGGTCYLLTDSAAPTNIPEGTPTTVTGAFVATAASGYASGSPTTPVTVNQVPGTNDAVTAANATITVGTGDALTYSIPVVTGAPVPAGSVAFTSGTTSLGSATWPASPATGTCPGGTGTCYLLTTNPAPVNIPLSTGANTPITGAFTATAASGYASASPTTSVVVGAAGGSGDTVTVANNPTTFGTADTLTFTIPVSSGAPAPVGTVTFTSGGTTLGTATWPANPTASGGNYTLSISPTNLPVSPTGSTTPVTATFVPGAGSGYGSAAPVNTVVVNKVPVSPGDGISANPTATTSGTTVTLTFTVANVNNTPATGTVTFTVGGITYGTANLTGTTANGVTTYTTTTTALPVGPDTVTGTYSGDGNYAGGALQTNVAISSNNTTDTVAVTTNPTVVESADTITFSIPVVTGAAAPTGTVVFTSGTMTLGTATFPAGATATGGFYTVSISTTALPLTVAPSTSTPVLATYTAGTGSGYASAAPVTSVVVNQVPSTGDTVAVTNNPTAVGSPDPITFSIPVVAGAPVPAGTVTFTSGTTALGAATWPANPTIANGAYTISIDPSNLPLSVTPGSTPVAASFAATPASGYASGTANTTVVVSPVTSTDTLAAANNPTTFGTADPLTFSIPVSSGAPAPVGTVTFTSGGTALGTATWPANPTPVNGFYTIAVSPTNIPVSTAATTPLSATFTAGAGSGYGNGTATSTVVVNKVPVSPGDGISANPTATTSGTTVTLTFTVANVNNTPATGTVTFTVGGITYGTANLTGTTANGVTTYTTTTTALPVGPDTVTGTYSGDGNYAGGALQTNVAISANNTADTVKVTTSPTVVESADTITFSIPVVTGSAAPTGTVVFTSGTTTLGTATFPAGATATGGFYTVSISTTALPLTVAPSTSTPVLATYTAGTGSGYASAAPVTSVVVNQVPSTNDTLTAQNATTIVGTADQLTFSIPAVAGAPVPAGTVTFTSGTTTLGTATWPGTPTATGGFYTISIDPTTLPLTVAPATSTPATATFAATAASGYASGTASANVVVNPVGGTGAALAVANNPTVVGAADTLTFSIPVNSGAPAPAGTVVFTSGTTNLGTATWPANVTPANGFYTISVSPTNIPLSAAGSTTPLTATFTASPGSGYGSSTPTANVTVTQIPGTGDTLTSTPNPSIYGQTVTFTETIPTVNGLTPSGTVTFAYNGTPIGTGTVMNGVATITTSTLPPGSDPVTASYGGNTNYAPVSNMVTQVVNPATPAGTLTPSTTTPACGTSVTLTESLTAITVPVAGTVQFYDNGVAIGSPVPVGVNGSASYTTSTLPCGTADKITAIFTPSAGSPYTPVTTGPTTVNVGAADFSIAATPANQTVNPGDTTVYNVSLSGVTVPFTSPVTLTATGLPPGATVTFANPTYVPGQGPTSTTMTIVTSPTQALLRTEQNGNQIFYGLLFLPLLGLRRVRRKLRALPKGITYSLAALLLLGGLGAMTGCGGGYFGPQPQTFTITVTGTSGTLSHSTTVTLTVR